MAARGGTGLIFPIYLYRKLEKILSSETTGLISIKLSRNVSLVTLYQDCSRHDLSKNMAARGRGLFFLYIYIENFNDLLFRNHWSDFNITFQECFLCNLYQDCSSRHDSSKNMAARGRGLFSLYIYIENFKTLLVRNHWTDFIITLQKLYIYIENFKNLLVRHSWTEFNETWQECCSGDLLPRLFKPSWYVKNHGPQGGGAYFSYISA